MSNDSTIKVTKREAKKHRVLFEMGKKMFEGGSLNQDDDPFMQSVISLVDDSTITVQEKITGLTNLQTLLLVPQVNSLYGADEIDYVTDKKARQARDLHRTIEDLKASVYDLQEYTNREEIDFKHPKVQKSFEFIVEGVLQVMKEQKIPDEDINEFIERFSSSMVGFEDTLDTRMRGVSNTTLDKVKNPLLEKYLDKLEAKSKGNEDTSDEELVDIPVLFHRE